MTSTKNEESLIIESKLKSQNGIEENKLNFNHIFDTMNQRSKAIGERLEHITEFLK